MRSSYGREWEKRLSTNTLPPNNNNTSSSSSSSSVMVEECQKALANKIPVSGNPLQSSNPIEEYIKLIVQKETAQLRDEIRALKISFGSGSTAETRYSQPGSPILKSTSSYSPSKVTAFAQPQRQITQSPIKAYDETIRQVKENKVHFTPLKTPLTVDEKNYARNLYEKIETGHPEKEWHKYAAKNDYGDFRFNRLILQDYIDNCSVHTANAPKGGWPAEKE